MKTNWLSAMILAFTPAAVLAGELELVESFPRGTTLDHANLRDAHIVWQEMIARAEESIDFGEFYVALHEGSRINAILSALEAKAAAGVRVRFLVDERFVSIYPDDLERLRAAPGIELRILNMRALTDGVMHAKYFVVDGREAYVGSQNFDWRSLEHIQELGVRIDDPRAARAVLDVFEYDWRLAAGEPVEAAAAQPDWPIEVDFAGSPTQISVAASPKSLLPGSVPWDLPPLIEAIDAAEERVRVQLLSYETIGYDKSYFPDLENAFRRAAARGVRVQLFVANWSQRRGKIEGLQSLQALANVEVRLATIPEAAEGFMPFARVVHSKYLVVDGRRGWIGSSNWSGNYFHASRNVGIVFAGDALGAALDRYFEAGWNSEYAAQVDPAAEYEAPRIGE